MTAGDPGRRPDDAPAHEAERGAARDPDEGPEIVPPPPPPAPPPKPPAPQPAPHQGAPHQGAPHQGAPRPPQGAPHGSPAGPPPAGRQGPPPPAHGPPRPPPGPPGGAPRGGSPGTPGSPGGPQPAPPGGPPPGTPQGPGRAPAAPPAPGRPGPPPTGRPGPPSRPAGHEPAPTDGPGGGRRGPPPRPPGSPPAAADEASTTGLTAPTTAVEAVDTTGAGDPADRTATVPGRPAVDPHATEALRTDRRDERTVRAARPTPLASWSYGGSADETVLLPRAPLEDGASAVPKPRDPADDSGRDDKALVRASGGMAVATLVSRLTGFLRTLGLTAIVGLNLVGSSFNVANTLPNIIFELLLGGVLTSVVIPVLVQAAKEDGDRGDAFAQKLLSGASVGLLVATALATVAAPLLIRPYLDPSVDVDLAVDFAYLLLPQIFFYGMGALFGAILNSRANFGPAAWAPVLNNVVALIALGVYAVLPSPPEGISTTQLLVLGLGSTLGIIVQAAVMLPAMRRVGFHWKWRFGWDRRLSAFGGLAAWVVGYVLVSQVGLAAIMRVASGSDDGGPAIYSYAWLLIQVPYGVLGVSLLTALMPRMSAAAANGRTDQVVADLSLGSRLSTVTLLPMSALLTVFGSQLGVALFSVGRSGPEGAASLGGAMAASAFGLLPMAVVMLQMRVFYAMNDARTPTLIMVVITAIKVPMAFLCPVLLPPEQVVLGLAGVNAFGFVVGLVVGNVWLRVRLGHLDTRRVLRTFVLSLLASIVAVLVAVLCVTLLERVLGGSTSLVLRSWLVLVSGSAIFLVVVAVAMRLLRVPELEPVVSRLRRLLGRRRASA